MDELDEGAPVVAEAREVRDGVRMVGSAVGLAEPLVRVHAVDAPPVRAEALGYHVGCDVDAAPEVRRVGGLADLDALARAVAVADLPAQPVVGHAMNRLGPVGREVHRVVVASRPQVPVVAGRGAGIRRAVDGEQGRIEVAVPCVDDLLLDLHY